MPSDQSHPLVVYRRGDPLDIPLIDNHLAIHLLFPRIINAIRWVLPELHLDWTTGSHGAAITDATRDETSSEWNRTKNSFLLKRVAEIIIHTSLLFGSSQLVRKQTNDGSFVSSITVRTPAMRNLGMFLRPKDPSTRMVKNAQRRKIIDVLQSRISSYSKLFAFVAATVIGPNLYEEIKHRRKKQLREQQRRQESIDMFQPSTQNNQREYTSIRQRQLARINERANDRQSHLQTLLSDFLIGAVDVFLPPLRLISYVSYLWGVTSTPDLGMQLVGWDYASFADSLSDASPGVGQQYRRHANYHYGNRRLLVEEALRTVSAVVPPRDGGAAVALTTRRQTRSNNQGNNAEHVAAQNDISSQSQRTPDRRGTWFLKRALSFMGVVEDNECQAGNDEHNFTCTKCGIENPTILYMASCGHCYCYICLRIEITDDLSFQCIKCGKKIDSSSRVEFNKMR